MYNVHINKSALMRETSPLLPGFLIRHLKDIWIVMMNAKGAKKTGVGNTHMLPKSEYVAGVCHEARSCDQ